MPGCLVQAGSRTVIPLGITLCATTAALYRVSVVPQAWHVCLSASAVDSGAGGVDGAAVTVTICGAADAATVTAGSGVTANVTAVVMMPATAALAPSDAVIAGQRRWFCRGSG